MIILALHFGHDACVTVLRDGEVASAVLRERFNRAKHACSIDLAHIELALADAGVAAADIDCCALVSTQNYELIIDDRSALSLALDAHPADTVFSPLRDVFAENGIAVADRMVG